MNRDAAYWVLLSSISGIGPKRFRALLDAFGSPRNALTAGQSELEAIPRITVATVENMRESLERIDEVEQQLCGLQDEEVEVLTWVDDRYPENLHSVPDAPPVLYVRGTVTDADRDAVAVVGSREASTQACQYARDLARAAADVGWTVVSGFALGVDAAAHCGVLDAGGHTLAVLGSGIRIIHPKEHAELAERTVASGALLSELKPNARPSGPNLMARDRLVSGLSRAVVVVEAAEGGGTMDTADRARKQGRLLCAVDWPHSGDAAAGNRQLLTQGAVKLPAETTEGIEIIRRQLESKNPVPQQQVQQRLF